MDKFLNQTVPIMQQQLVAAPAAAANASSSAAADPGIPPGRGFTAPQPLPPSNITSKRWNQWTTAEHDKLLEGLAAGYNMDRLAALLPSRNDRGVEAYMARQNLKFVTPIVGITGNRWTTAEHDKSLEGLAAGLQSTDRLAALLPSRTVHGVQKYIKRHKLQDDGNAAARHTQSPSPGTTAFITPSTAKREQPPTAESESDDEIVSVYVYVSMMIINTVVSSVYSNDVFLF